MLVALTELVDFMGDDSLTTNSIFTALHSEVEGVVKSYCNRAFESASYIMERYDGDGGRYLFLKQYPVTALDRLAIGTQDIIRIKNTNVYTTASVSVTSTGLRLVKDRTATTTVLFSSSTTMSAVVTAVNAISGWSAELLSSLYSSWKSNELITMYGRNVIDNNYVYLSTPYDAEDNFDLDLATGRIYKASGFAWGISNIFVDYTAGYATIPDDLQHAVKIFIKTVWDKKTSETWNLRRYTIGDITYEFGAGGRSSQQSISMPIEVLSILSQYRKRLV